jgi:hypothetical protein
MRELQLQPSLTKDSFFMSLNWTDVDFVVFESLSLGFVDAFPEVGESCQSSAFTLIHPRKHFKASRKTTTRPSFSVPAGKWSNAELSFSGHIHQPTFKTPKKPIKTS